MHEAYLRLIGADAEQAWDGRGHFFAAAAEAMRRILVENARRKRRRKHGGGRQRQDLPLDEVAAPESDDELLDLDAALQKLAEHDPQKAKLVELRYFAGLTGDQAAGVLGISPRTADRHWVYARAWLRRAIQGASEATPPKKKTKIPDAGRRLSSHGEVEAASRRIEPTSGETPLLPRGRP